MGYAIRFNFWIVNGALAFLGQAPPHRDSFGIDFVSTSQTAPAAADGQDTADSQGGAQQPPSLPHPRMKQQDHHRQQL